ncbi:type II toxin-antitoxin system VapC family toxin [Okeania sp. SIO2B3]|uniref:type II toxin-antitoxin system VapC family toxin n=1 Tax=Okeania sp. SIO2B3 TaxID=2607784 RepID=UPI0013C15D69|nr:type II toxin-antitoxin system VapC family toxin [Okeania sp. SIO2B3]NET46279.1 type II toxin-antitoxin system VapC family toxin [Okeania sp. SIO2B3]
MTRYLLDTNILLRASDPTSSNYQLAVDSVFLLLNQNHECLLTAQVLIEFWVVATRPIEVNGLGWTPERTRQQINILISQFALLSENGAIFTYWLELVITHNIRGKRTHDIRLLAVMKSHGINCLLTFNPEDFITIPEIKIVTPQEITTNF